ncbi:MAG: glycosyltransferase family 4 protein [Patescibacteria group bacterium]|jgi:glycosyltransferase involved in cell wall biosynthesis
MPTEKANGYQIAKMCEAFSNFGLDVTLVVPKRKNAIFSSLFDYYSIKQNFQVRSLPLFDWLTLDKALGRVAFYLLSFSFLLRVHKQIVPIGSIVYSRTLEVAWLFSRKGYKTFFECHQMPNKKSRLFSFFIKPVTGIIAITQGLKSDLVEKYGYPSKKILVAPDGVDLETFNILITREEARKKLDLPMDKKIVLYTGHLYKWKGVDTLAQAVTSLPLDTLVYMVGGTEEEIKLFKQRNFDTSRIINVAARPREEIAVWLKAADVLILPNSGKEAISEKYTSPLKLFEYMASGTPIVASDLPSIREIIGPEDAEFFIADNPADLARAIRSLLADVDQAKLKAEKAYALGKNFSWINRAKNILVFLA